MNLYNSNKLIIVNKNSNFIPNSNYVSNKIINMFLLISACWIIINNFNNNLNKDNLCKVQISIIKTIVI